MGERRHSVKTLCVFVCVCERASECVGGRVGGAKLTMLPFGAAVRFQLLLWRSSVPRKYMNHDKNGFWHNGNYAVVKLKWHRECN